MTRQKPYATTLAKPLKQVMHMQEMSKQYRIIEKDFSGAKLLTPSKSALALFNRPKEENFPDAPYWWPLAHTRFHAYKLFTPAAKVVKAEASFLCDNLFDLWLNGQQFAFDTRHLRLTDITALVCAGENNLHIRGYQTGTDESFISAITGGIRLSYDDGTRETIFLDQDARILQLVNFYDSDREPDGFETMTSDFYAYVPKVPGVYPLHPIALRRSFYYIRPFSVEEMPVKATLYASALGCYEPYLNGSVLSDARLIPFGTNYVKEYQTFDLLPFLKKGTNVVGMITGNGSYNCYSWGTLTANVPALAAILELEYRDGRQQRICSDERWLCAPSPLVDNDLQYGERYDARLEIDGWCTEDYPAGRFYSVNAEDNKVLSALIAQNYPPVKAVKEYHPRRIGSLGHNVPLFDVGLCIAGRARIKLRNPHPGQKIRIRYCERMKPDGTPQLDAYSCVFYCSDCAPGGRSDQFLRNMDVYTAKGACEEVYECRFSYTGFQYLWIEGLDSEEQLAELTALELRNDLAETGHIDTNSAELMQIFRATRRSWYNNIFNGPTDCPTREKNFWNGDSQIFSHTACFLSDCSDFLARWTHNGIKMEAGPYGWEDETYEIPYTLYRFYGDKGILRATYPKMLELIEKRQEFPGMVLPENPCAPYCDWLSPTGISPSRQFFSGCYYYHMLDRISEIAAILGDNETAAALRARASTARAEFNRRHLCPDGRDYDAHNQCGIVLPIAFGIAPEEHREALVRTLVEYIRESDYHVTTGFIGTRYLPEVLADYGYSDTVYRLLVQPSAPSWMDMLKNGASAISESWYGLADPDGGISMAHFSLGAITGWFFEYLGGLRVNDSAPGLSHVVLKPHPIQAIGRFDMHYQTPMGQIHTHWHFEGDTPIFQYTLPEGITAEVLYPKRRKELTMKSHGIWIWENTHPRKDEYADFADRFVVSTESEPVSLEISADSNYAVYVNGSLAAFGQYSDFPHCKVVNTHDISPFCVVGENALLITVWYWGETTFSYYPGQAGLYYQVRTNGAVSAISGEHTRCRKNPHYLAHQEKMITWILGYSFCYDAADKDIPWHPAVPTGYAPTLHPRPIDTLELQNSLPGICIGGNDRTHFLLDLGQEEVGFLELALESSHHQRILIAYGEHLVDGSVPMRIGDRDFSVEYIAKPGKNQYLNPFRRLGCRYLEIFCQQPITLHRMGIRPTMYPVNVLPFRAGNDRRQQIYDTAVRTLRLCMHEHYEDCPWREQALYGMDSRNQMLFGYHAFGETQFPRASLWLFAQDNRPDGLLTICAPSNYDLVIPSFCLHWYQAVLEYTEYSRDLTLAREIWPKLCSVLDAFCRFLDSETGLLTCLPGNCYWNFYEWTDRKLSDHNRDMEGTDLLLNCLFLRALQAMNRLAELTGLSFGLSHLEEPLKHRIRSTFRRSDGLYATDPEHTHLSELGCALAVLTGTATQQDARAICRLLTDHDQGDAVPVSLSMTPFVYDALLQTDREKYSDYVLDDIDARCGYMLDQGATTFWETLNGWQDFGNAGSLCHGWSAMAVYYYRMLL